MNNLLSKKIRYFINGEKPTFNHKKEKLKRSNRRKIDILPKRIAIIHHERKTDIFP